MQERYGIKMTKRKIAGLFAAIVLVFGGCGAEQELAMMQDGTYTAQMAEYSHGWREYVTITVKNGVIVTVEYDAESPSGFIKSWDNAYMNNMKAVTGTYPNEYTRFYAAQLRGQTEAPEIDALAGASSSGANFVRLSQVVVEKAQQGDSTIALVKPAEH